MDNEKETFEMINYLSVEDLEVVEKSLGNGRWHNLLGEEPFNTEKVVKYFDVPRWKRWLKPKRNRELKFFKLLAIKVMEIKRKKMSFEEIYSKCKN